MAMPSSDLMNKDKNTVDRISSKRGKHIVVPVTKCKASKEVAQPQSDVDSDLFAELQALVKECAAANPEADEESEDKISKQQMPSATSAKSKKGQIIPALTSEQSAQQPSSSYSNKIDRETSKNGIWNFDVDYNDHFETPIVAYTDIKPMLLALAESLGKKPEDLIIYDPYYCQGGMVMMLKGLGFPRVNDDLTFFLTRFFYLIFLILSSLFVMRFNFAS